MQTGVPKTKAHHPTLLFNQNLIFSNLTPFQDIGPIWLGGLIHWTLKRQGAVQLKPKSMLQMNVQTTYSYQ